MSIKTWPWHCLNGHGRHKEGFYRAYNKSIKFSVYVITKHEVKMIYHENGNHMKEEQ